MRARLLNIFLLLLSFLIMAAVFELACRTIVNTGTEYHIEMWKYAVQLKRVSADPEIGHEHVPNSHAKLMGVNVTIDSQGLRNAEIGPKTPGTQRILMLGDSIVFGWGVEQDKTMSVVLAQMLPNTEVINSGVGNYNTAMEVAYFKDHGAALSPDIVVLNYFINDAEPTPTYSDVPWLARHAYAYAVLGGAWDTIKREVLGGPDWRTYYADLYRDGEPGWLKAQANIAALAQECRRRNIRLVIANVPELRELADYPFLAVNAKLKAVAEANGIEYLDLLPVLQHETPSSLWVTAPDPHPDAKAHRLMGEALAAYFAQKPNAP